MKPLLIHQQCSIWASAILILCWTSGICGIQWLGVASKLSAVGTGSAPINGKGTSQMCNSMRGSLIKKQINFCKRNPEIMESVQLGAARAIDECQFQFRSRRWNCLPLDKNNITAKMDLGHLPSFTNSGSSNRAMELPMNGGGSSHGGGFNNGMNPFPYSNSMHNNMYMPNSNSYRSNDRSSRQVQQQAFNRNNRNIRRGRRLSRRARHGLNGNKDPKNNQEEDDDDVTNDTRMVSNPVQQGQVPSMPPTPVATPSILPSKWSPPYNLSSFSSGIPLDSLNSGGSKENKKERKNDKKKNKKKKRRKGKKDKAQMGPYPVVSPGTREAAFVHAISSAGVAHALTRACSSGKLENCGCDRSLRGISPEGFQWSGCSDNVDFGITFSRNFVDARDRRKSRKNPNKAQPFMNLHNNEAGRKLLERNMKVDCKCHGVSGSCELKTCWRSVPPFRMIGEILKKKFDIAQEVRQRKRRGRRMLEPRFQRFKPHTDTDLVFLKESPTYCDFDVEHGSLGTQGRECDPRGKGPESCDAMCCRRGHTTRKEIREERCKCKFHWCCFVQCDVCEKEVIVSTCN